MGGVGVPGLPGFLAFLRRASTHCLRFLEPFLYRVQDFCFLSQALRFLEPFLYFAHGDAFFLAAEAVSTDVVVPATVNKRASAISAASIRCIGTPNVRRP